MKLSTLVDRESFALLGPGFGGGRCLLVSKLRAVALQLLGGNPRDVERPLLIYAPFEQPGEMPFGYQAGSCREVDVVLDVQPRPLTIALHADDFRRQVARIREWIARGDVYQVCCTVRADVAPATGAELVARLCARGMPRFTAWVRLPDGEEFVSASPELFFAIRGRRIRAEPMKGTSGRQDAAFLESSSKDRSELAMITDLMRNDLARVCRPRSVHVVCPRRVVELPYALQCVSDVAGDLADGATALDALAALHPGGSVTGAPKQAALEMIRNMEPGPRGAYCGALGLCRDGGATFSLLIRTATNTPAGWVYGVGNGIVYESDPEMEMAELRVKLGALLDPPLSPLPPLPPPEDTDGRQEECDRATDTTSP